MGGDVPAGAAAGVLGDEVADPVPEAARAGDEPADAVHLAQLAGSDLDQGDEVVGLPEAVDVGLAEADAAAQRPAPGGRVVDLQGGAEVGVGRSVAAFARAFDDVDAAAADPAEDGPDAGPGERVPHGETNPRGRLPSGCGWYFAPFSFSRSDWA